MQGAMAFSQLSAVVLTVLVTAVQAWEICYNYHDRNDYIECQHGCCGDSWNRRCCTKQELTIGMIVLGVILFIGLIVTIVVIIVCRRRRANRGQVFRQNAAGTTMPGPQMVTYNTPAAAYPYGGGYTNYGGPQMQVTTMTTAAPAYTPGFAAPPPTYDSLQNKPQATAPPM